MASIYERVSKAIGLGSTSTWSAAELAHDLPRDFVGYGRVPPTFNLPEGKKIAVNFVINYEEGGEHSVAHGDTEGEVMLQETGPGKIPLVGERDTPVETSFEYGSRVGIWRLLNLFEKHNIRVTMYAVGLALEQNPPATQAMLDGGHEIASHCWRWFNFEKMSAAEEEWHIREGIKSYIATTGKAPVGWYYGRPSPRTRSLLAKIYKELGLELLYVSDDYSDDLPHWRPSPVGGKGLLHVPYSYVCNDFKLYVAPGFGTVEAFAETMLNAAQTLLEEGRAGKPKMMTIALHARLIGQPARFPALKKVVETLAADPDVWFATREEIAREWVKQYPDPYATA
nr:carbohydrate esterase family 4 protein [Naematelia aurantialba]